MRLKNRNTFLLIAVVWGISSSNLKAQTIWDVQSKYGTVDASVLQQAMEEAVEERASNPDVDIVMQIPSGTFYLNAQITVPPLNAKGTGWLIIQGEGAGNTRLVDTEYQSNKEVTFEFIQPYRLKICDLSIFGDRLIASQGTIVSINRQNLDIELDPDFPTPNDMFEIESNKANKIRLMLDTDLNSPHYVEGEDNDHQSNRWTFQGDYDHNDNPQTRPFHLYGSTWRFKLSSSDPHPFNVGDRVGVSSKSNRSNWAIFKGDGADIIVENVALHRLGRVKFRNGWENIRFSNVKIVRPEVNGKPAFYSTDAGPQFGHDNDGVDVKNLIVENCDFRGTVDDGIAFQRVVSGYATGNRWEDGGGALVGINCGEAFSIHGNTFYHCPLEDNRYGAVHFKGAYAPQVIYDDGQAVQLTWMAGSDAEVHDVFFGTTNPPPLMRTQHETIFELPNTLKPNTTYYWKVHERNESRNLGVNESDVWRFATGISTSTVSIEKNEPLTVAYPNPVFNEVTLQGRGVSDEDLAVFDLHGNAMNDQVEISRDQGECLKVNVRRLNPGVYFLITKDETIKIYKQ